MSRLAPLIAIAIASFASTPHALAASTRAEYVAQADPICERAAERQAKVDAFFLSPKELRAADGALLGRFARGQARLARIERGATAAIAPIPPAPGDETTVAAWVDSHRHLNRLIARMIRAAKRGNADAAGSLLAQAGAAARHSAALVAGFGFRFCG